MRKECKKIMDKMNNKFGFNAIRQASDLEDYAFRISTGSLSLDIALGGGIPAGRLIHICGGDSSAKSLLAYHIAKNAQKMFKEKIVWEKFSTKEKPVMREIISSKDTDTPLSVALIQSESHSYTNAWASKIGLNTDELMIVYPANMEEALDIASALQESGVNLIIHDSYAAYTPQKAIEVDQGDSMQMGIKQQRFSQYHGKLSGANNVADREGRIPTTVLAINQLREKIGQYGNPEYSPGGRNVRHTMAIDIRLRKGEMLTVGKEANKHIIGMTVKFKVDKNKAGVPYRTGSFDLYFEEGGPVPAGHIDNEKEVIVESMLYGVVERSGSWYYYKGNKLAQGADKTIELLRTDKKLYDEIREVTLQTALSSAKVEREEDELNYEMED